MGLLEPTNGELIVDNQKIDDSLIRAWRQTVAHVPQSIFLADTSIAENIAFGVMPEKIDMSRVKDAAKKAMISDFIDNRPNG